MGDGEYYPMLCDQNRVHVEDGRKQVWMRRPRVQPNNCALKIGKAVLLSNSYRQPCNAMLRN